MKSTGSSGSWEVRDALMEELKIQFEDFCKKMGCEASDNFEASMAILKTMKAIRDIGDSIYGK